MLFMGIKSNRVEHVIWDSRCLRLPYLSI